MMPRLGAAALSVVLLSACQQAPVSSVPETKPAIRVTFRGLWFSEAEMLRIGKGEKNVSPTTDIELKVWEYTDPIGSPHPDIVNVVIETTSTVPVPAAIVTLREQWKIGGPDGEATATWQEPLRERRTPSTVRLVPGQTSTVTIPVAVGDQVRRLGPSDRYPWRLRVNVELLHSSSGAPLATAVAELPIIPGQ